MMSCMDHQKVSCAKETIQPDPHSPGSALPTSSYAADIGYLVDGTPCSGFKGSQGMILRF